MWGSSHHAPLLLSAWKEIIIIVFLTGTGAFLLWHWKKWIRSIDTVDILIVAFSGMAGLSAVLITQDSFQAIIGIKYDLFFLWLFFAFRKLFYLFPQFQKKYIQYALYAVISSGIGVILFACLHVFLPHDFLVSFGYFADASVDAVNKPASYCQLLENTTQCRWQSVLAGPIRLGAFLILFLGSIFASKIFSKYVQYFLIAISFVVLGYTFSRAAWIGAIVFFGTVALGTIDWKKISKKIWMILFGMFFTLIIFASGFLIFSNTVQNTIIRSGSTSAHYQGAIQSIETIHSHPEGIGIGNAGPASAQLGPEKKFLNENWYLQIFTELGVLGGILFMLICFIVLQKLYFQNTIFFATTLALMSMACFTHVWEESSVAYTLWILIGILLAKKNESE